VSDRDETKTIGEDVTSRDDGRARPGKRPLKSRLIELGLWALLSIATAVVMILLSNKLLPANF
jgi:hypothetical protein